jgi:hypothetical protein
MPGYLHGWKWIVGRLPDDRVENVSQAAPEVMARRMAAVEDMFCGISAVGACEVALRIARQVENAKIVFVVVDRGDRYLSTGVSPPEQVVGQHAAIPAVFRRSNQEGEAANDLRFIDGLLWAATPRAPKNLENVLCQRFRVPIRSLCEKTLLSEICLSTCLRR